MNRREQAYRIGGEIDADNFDIEEAIYWWCCDHHKGQTSEEYSILSTSEFRPSRLANGPETEMSLLIYDKMCSDEKCQHSESRTSSRRNG